MTRIPAYIWIPQRIFRFLTLRGWATVIALITTTIWAIL